MMLCLIDEYGRTLKDKSIIDLTIRFMKHEGISKVENMSGGRLNNPEYLLNLINHDQNNLEIIFISNNSNPYKLGIEQKQNLIKLLSQNSNELSGTIIKTLLQQDGTTA